MNSCDLRTAPQENHLVAYPVEVKPFVAKENGIKGLIISLSIVGFWLISMIFLLTADLTKISYWLIAIAMIWQIFLYTGLFITAHDAMHGAIFRPNKKVNHFIGALSVWFYGFFSYKEMLKKHGLHHHHPASELDPDYHDGKHSNPILWYFHFMKEYWSWNRFIGQSIAYYFATGVLHIHEINIVLFWIVPPILSSIQLFYFGSYLPHKEPQGGYINPHRAQTIAMPVFWSFITCYHFGYHREHHEYPHIAWWQLPAVYQAGLLKR